MKKKLILGLVFILLVVGILVAYFNLQKDDVTNDVPKEDAIITEIKDSGYEGYDYEVGIRDEVKKITNTNYCSFAITDDVNFFMTIEGNRSNLNANKNKIIEYLQKDTKYETVTLIMYDVGGSVSSAFCNERIK